ncbi:MAG: hypothetical protein K6T87_16030 [Roseiflexus sp.]|uniref:hypothetical protein n=1 Tax=Roseiflexus sp. TaxID=2562120 RepID=UPI0025EAB061|nr:hypothetical protein [Roseiflexus sp.]MCL6542065.1 hypothetical protein [Roseiflexus sp.]
MKPDDIFRLLKEDSNQILEGLSTIESLSKNLSAVAQALGNIAQDAKKIISIAENVSRRIQK